MTKNEKAVLDAIRAFNDEHGHCPTFRQLSEIMGRKSSSALHRPVERLREYGKLAHGRSIRLQHADDKCPICGTYRQVA